MSEHEDSPKALLLECLNELVVAAEKAIKNLEDGLNMDELEETVGDLYFILSEVSHLKGVVWYDQILGEGEDSVNN